MNRTITKLTEENYKTTHWGGGMTSEIVIHPQSAAYAKRDFDFRISTATVEDEECIFTELKGYERLLMVTEGTIKLKSGEEEVELGPQDIHRFDGGAKTICLGKCKDFNLMVRHGLKGNMEVLQIKEDFTKVLLHNYSTYSILLLKGKVGCHYENERICLQQGDTLVFSKSMITDFIELEKSGENAVVVICSVC